MTRKDDQILINDRRVTDGGGSSRLGSPPRDRRGNRCARRPRTWDRASRSSHRANTRTRGYRRRSAHPIRRASMQRPVVTSPGAAGIELPDLFARHRVHRKHFLSGRIPVEHAVDDDGIGLQRAGSVSRVVGPGNLQLAHVRLIDLLECRIARSASCRRQRAIDTATLLRVPLNRAAAPRRRDTPEFQSSMLHTAFQCRPRTLDEVVQNVAIGFNCEPVAPGMAAGAAVTRKSHRFRLAASLPTASRSRLSKIGMPIARSTSA